MSDFKVMDDTQRLTYWTGSKNKIVRYWVYLEKGMELINKGRYFILAILGLYFTLKLTNPLWLGVMFVVGTPTLIVVGRYYLHRVSRIQEWVNATFGSVLGYQQFNAVVESLEELRKIRELLEQHDFPKRTHSKE